MLGILIALLSGALMSIQGVFNTEVTKNTCVWVSNCWVQITAFAVCLIGWFFTGRQSFGGLFVMDHKYMLFGGVIGAFITLTVIQSMSQLGPARAVMLIVAYLIELFGLFGVEKVEFDWRKVIGMGLAISGIIIFKWK